MLKNKYKTLLVCLLMIIVMMLTSTSMAVDYSCKVSLFGNATEVKKGDSVTLLVKATEIQAGEGIASFNAILEYNPDVFDCTVSGDDEGTWTKQGLIENSLTMARSDFVASSSDQTIAKIVLTAKENATLGEQSFKLIKMEFSTGEETFEVADVSTTITITEGSGNGSGNGNTNTNTGSGSGDTNTNTGNGNTNTNTGGGNTDTNTGTNGGTSTNTDKPNGNGSSNNGGNSSSGGSNVNGKNTSTIANSVSVDKSIPKTGITDVLIIGAVIGTIAAIVFYIKYKRIY